MLAEALALFRVHDRDGGGDAAQGGFNVVHIIDKTD
jgi:hypothetical protein